MKTKDFNEIVEEKINFIRKVLTEKAKQYSTDKDRLHNFKKAGQILGISPEKALLSFKTKHDVSIIGIVDKLDAELPSEELLEEKIGDSINYLILLEALIKERINESSTIDCRKEMVR